MSSGLETSRDFQVGLAMAWHGQTKVVTTIEQAEFPEIVPLPVYFQDTKGEFKAIAPVHIPVALDDGLPCGAPHSADTYSLFTPKNAWDYVHGILEGTGFTVESIGMLKNRTVWFLSVKLDEVQATAINGDSSETRFQFNFSGGLNRQFSPQCELSAIRAVCWNTVSLSRMSGKVLFKAKATKNFKQKLDIAKTEIEAAVGMTKIFIDTLANLSKKACDTSRAERIYTGFLAPMAAKKRSTRLENTTEELVSLFGKTETGNQGKSLLDVFNGFTEYRTRGSLESSKSRWDQFESSEFGLYADQKADFANVLADRNRLTKIEARGKELLLA